MGEFCIGLKPHRLKAVLFFIVLGLIGALSLIIINGQNAAALDENNCLSCHSKLDVTKTNSDGQVVSLRISENDVNNAAHRYIDCTTCHTSKPHETPPRLTKQSSAEKCGTCHAYEYKQHLNSVHGEQLAQGNSDVATCVDCHSPKGDAHSVIRVLEYGAPTYKKNIAETCAKCHNDEDLMQSYGIVDKVYESYMRSYHGKAMELSSSEITQLNTATCTNCHGTHNIMAISDSASPVSGMENLARTCDQCHSGAGVEFAKGFLGHEEASPHNVPAAYYVEKSFGVLLFSVLGVGGLVVLGAIFRFSMHRWRR